MTEPERCGHSCSLRLLMKGFKRLWLVLVYVVLWKVLSDQWLIWSHLASTNPDKSAVVEEKGPVILRSPKKAVTTLTNTKHALQTAAQLLGESSNDAFDNFRFYVYDDLPREYTYQGITECIAELYPRNTSNCDFATTLCTQSYSHMARYSKRRFNRNADLVMAKIFSQYRGPLRTYNAHEADLFIVPYPSTGHCECRMRHERCVQDVPEAEVDALIHNLTFFNASTMHRHLFLSSIDYLDTYPYFLNHKMPLITTIGPAKTCELDKPCGKIVIPYANLNPENQPSVITKERFMQKRMYAIVSFMSTKIKGNNWARKQFKQAIKQLDNFTLAGMPVLVSGTQFGRTLSNETQVQEAYHQSIFCPCLRGDEPPQKRFFDALLAGCIPVVLDYESDELGYRSYFAERTYSTRLSYPFATGIFAGKSDMGVHYEDLVVAINSTCNMECLLPTLEDLIQNHPEVIREKQANIARVASLFTYGINDNAFQYPDATAAILIQAKHYVDAVGR